jgi:membrane-associated phospholipid phosphatase
MPRIIEPRPEKSNPEQRRGKRLPFVLGYVGLLLLVTAFTIDVWVDSCVASHQVAAWHQVASACSRYFAWHWLMGMALVVLVIAWRIGRRDIMRVICAMMVASSIAGLSADFLRGMTGRTRPYFTEAPQGFYGVHDGSRWLITKHAYNSFPSGHTAAITGFAVPLLLWRRRLVVVVVPLIAVVAAARIYLGAHHLSDVIASMILGSIVAAWVWRQIGSGKWQLSAERFRQRRVPA